MGRQDLTTEIYYGGVWQTAPAYVRDPAAITRGRGNESGEATAGTAELTLDNRTGNYNPRNASSPLFGLVGRNTPMRAGLDLAVESFGGTSSSGWTPTDGGLPWTGLGAAAADFTEGGGLGLHLQPLKNIVRISLLADERRDVEQVTTAAIPAVALGASAVVGHVARRQTSGDYYWLRMELDVAGAVTAKISKTIGGVFTELAALSGIPGLTYAGAQGWNFRSSVSGGHLAIRIWKAGDPEPTDWTLTATDTTITTAGRYGLASWVVSGNTNTTEVRFDNYRAVDRRFVDEVASWKPGRTVDFNPATGKGDAWTKVEAAGILRRLGQGNDPLDSPLRRAILAANPTAYWPLEDADGAVSAQSAVAGVADMQPFGYSRFTAPGTGKPVAAAGLPKFGSGNGIPGSAPLVDLAQGGVLAGDVPEGPATIGWRLEFVMLAPRDKASARIPIRWSTDGTWSNWELQIEAGDIFATFGTSPTSGASGTATATFNVFDGQPHHYQIEAFQTGGNLDARIYVDDLQVATYSVVAGSPGSIQSVIVNPLEEVNGTASMPVLGHVAVWNPATGLTTSAEAMTGHLGETAGARFLRLCAEEGIPAAVVGDAADTQPMGAQRIATLTELLAEIERTDDGLVYDPRDSLGLVLRTGVSLLNQPAALTVDYAAGQVKPPFEPVIDDLATRNDVTAKSTTTGATARAVLETGAMSVQPPPAGVGRYKTQIDVNPATDDRLADHAGWRLHKGTVDETRFPRVTVDLAESPTAAAVDVGDRIDVVNLPADIAPGLASLIVIGYTETVGSHRRLITFICVPASPYNVATVDGPQRVAGDGSTLASGVSSSAMTLSIATPTLPALWTVDPADFPLDLRVGAEQVRVSAISGASSPQTATVTARGVNGVQLAWPAGTEVDVWQPAVVAL